MSDRRRGPLDPNVAGALAYVVGPLSGLLVLLAVRSLVRERENLVRFHAVQSLLTFTGIAILQLALRSLPVVGTVAAFPFVIGVIVLWGMLIFRALRGDVWKLPLVGEIAATQLER